MRWRSWAIAGGLAGPLVACGQNGGRPGELGVYVVPPGTLEADAASDPKSADAASDEPQGATPDGGAAVATDSAIDAGCKPGGYQGTYAGFYDTVSSGLLQIEGALGLTLSGKPGDGTLVATGTLALEVTSDVSFPLEISGTLDCTTLAFAGTMTTAPGSSSSGLLSATYDVASASLVGGRFALSFNTGDPPMLDAAPQTGASGTFIATWVRP